jgi:FkbM family methyltransferase
MKQWIQSAKFAVYDALDVPGGRFLLAGAAAAYATLRLRKRCSVTHDQHWVQRFPTGTIVEPRLTLYTLEQIDQWSSDLWMHAYQPGDGDVVVDVGAGTGWDTLAFSRRVGPRGRVVSIEAHPAIFACLQRMCGENRLDNVTLVHAAITGSAGDVLISDAQDHLGHRIVGIDRGVPVRGMTLDELCHSLRLNRIDLLKMNIEGAEKQAIRGMQETIRQASHVCIACHDFAVSLLAAPELETKDEITAFLEENNFCITSRVNDPRPWVRDFVYAVNRAPASTTRGVSSPLHQPA